MLYYVQLDEAERAVGLPEFEELVRSGRIGPETPVRTATGGWRAAREVPHFSDLAQSPEAMLRRAWSTARVPWLTVLIVGIEIRIHLWLAGGFVSLKEELVRSTPAILEQGQVWRLYSYALLHADVGHIAFNLLLIAYVGAALEGVLGAAGLGTLFAFSVFWGGLASALSDPTVIAIGASAADFGYLGAGAVFGLRWLDLLPVRARTRFGGALLLYVAYSLVNGMLAEEVDNSAHIGGLLSGVLLTSFLRPRLPQWRTHNRVVLTTAWASMALMSGVLLTLPPRMAPVEADGLVGARPSLWVIGFGAGGDPGWKSEVTDATLVVDTTRTGFATLHDAVESFEEDYGRLDPKARFEYSRSSRGAVSGVLIVGTYASKDGHRVVTAEMYLRGRYLHRIVLDLPVGMRQGEALRHAVFDAITLPPPNDVARARALPDSWSAKIDLAKAEAEAGAETTARDLLNAARAEAPDQTAPVIALLELGGADVGRTVPEALATFPDDRRVRAAAIRALYAGGDQVGAKALLEQALLEAPGDRRYEKLERELFGVSRP